MASKYQTKFSYFIQAIIWIPDIWIPDFDLSVIWMVLLFKCPIFGSHCISKHVKSGVLVSFGFHWISIFLHHSILGHYINLDLKKLKTAGAFCNKIWQANRFYVQAAERLRTDSIKLAEFDQFLNKSTSQQLEELNESSR